MDSFISLTPEHYLSADDTTTSHSSIYTFAGHAIANVLCRHHLVSVFTATQCSQINCAVLSGSDPGATCKRQGSDDNNDKRVYYLVVYYFTA